MKKNQSARTRKRSLSGSVFALVTLSAAIAAMGAANAQSFAPHAYVGGAYGVTNARGDFNGQVFRAGQSLTGGNMISNIRSDRSASGGKFFVGYQFHGKLAAELSYVDFGKFNAAYQFSGINSFTRQYAANWRADGIALDLVASAEVMPKLSVSGRVGVMQSSLKYGDDTVPGGLNPFTAPTERQTRPHFGVGLGYDITPTIGAQLGWERTVGVGRNFSFSNAEPDRSNGKLDYDLVSLGLTYRFR